MAMAVGMVMTPATAAAAAASASGGAQQRRQHHPTCLPLMTGASRQRRGGSRGQTQWAPLTVRSIATGPPKSAAEVDWKTKREVLLKNKLRSVSVKEALRLQQEQGYVILDVRPEAEFEEAHPTGAINVQLYRLIKEWTPWDIARRAAFAFFGIFAGTEENPEFLKDVTSKLDKGAKIVIGCQSGGTMKPTPNLADGQQSRSLIAAYILTLEGYKNIVHMEGGIRNWFKEDLPVEGGEAESTGSEN